jgi:GNAT superfamily N-acetyltransferase
MTRTFRIRAADMPRDLPTIQNLCTEYREELLGLGGEIKRAVETLYHAEAWDSLLAGLPEKHARPKGSILLIETEGMPFGCGMIQALSDDDAEIKRVFIQPSAQGKGAGEALSQALIEQAQADGYRRILLDTTKASRGARALYEKLGFKSRGPYADLPDFVLPLMVFYELKL